MRLEHLLSGADRKRQDDRLDRDRTPAKNNEVIFRPLYCFAIYLKYNHTFDGGLAQLARAPALHAGGQRFESVILHIRRENVIGERMRANHNILHIRRENVIGERMRANHNILLEKREDIDKTGSKQRYGK